jgi:hypothetical protein
MGDSGWQNYRGIDATIKLRLVLSSKAITEDLVVPSLAWARIGESFPKPSAASGKSRNTHAPPTLKNLISFPA